MELRRVDPKILKQNPGNPRRIQPGEMPDAALAASIRAIGILQPPAVTEQDSELTIAYGARRVKIAIALGLEEIHVLVKDADESDRMRAWSENVVRAPMATVDLWRAIESLVSENWTEEAIAGALAISVRQIRKLRLLANVHLADENVSDDEADSGTRGKAGADDDQRLAPQEGGDLVALRSEQS
jgi:ParB family chromosome partitioning protein